jgi:hypothetical protein
VLAASVIRVMNYRPDVGGSENLWNDGKLLPDYTAQYPRRQVTFVLAAVRTWNLTVMILQVPQKARNYLTNSAIFDFSKRTLAMEIASYLWSINSHWQGRFQRKWKNYRTFFANELCRPQMCRVQLVCVTFKPNFTPGVLGAKSSSENCGVVY